MKEAYVKNLIIPGNPHTLRIRTGIRYVQPTEMGEKMKLSKKDWHLEKRKLYLGNSHSEFWAEKFKKKNNFKKLKRKCK